VSYLLGVDVGTTYTAAAVVAEGRAEVIPLGNRSSVVPTVIFLREDEQVLVGEAANRRSLTDPGRVAREFKRRVGDTAPILLGGSPLSPQSLMAKMLRWVVDHVTSQQGEPPTHIAASHPANWGPYKLDLLEQAIRMADLSDCTTLTEPEAAAAYYASHERMEPGEAVAVYDLGGGTFDAAVVRRTEVGFDILGTPEGIEHLGGVDIDEAVFAYARRSLDGALDELDPSDTTALAAVARLRQECVEAKEALSGDVEATIPVLLPNVQTQISLTRPQLEDMIRPLLGDTVTALRRALRSAEMAPDDIRAVLLVGGSSRIPLVAGMVGEELGRPVAVDTHPKHSVALGTALAAEEAVARSQGLEPVTIDVVPPRPTPQPRPAEGPGPGVGEAPAATASTEAEPTTTADPTAPMDPAAPVSAGPPAVDPLTSEQAVATPTEPGSRTTVRAEAPSLITDAGPGEPEEADAGETPANGAPGRRAILVAGALVGVMAVAALVGFVWPRGEPEGQDLATAPATDEVDEVEEVEEVVDEDAGEPDDAPPTSPFDDPGVNCDGTLCIAIDDVRLEDGQLVIDWTPYPFEPDVAATHAHFYWDVYGSHQVGSNAADFGYEQRPWELTDNLRFVPEDEMALSNRPPDATGVCVTVADGNHAVIDPGNHHCVPLPEGAALAGSCDGVLCIRIDEVRVVGGELAIEWSPDGFEPDNAATHAHFYWDIYLPSQVGTNAADLGAEQAPWELTDQRPFVPRAEMQLTNRPVYATGICVTVADGNHAVINPDSFHCVPLPADA
jgi:molecular chaperone DnaK